MNRTRKPVRPSFRFKVVFPDGFSSDIETRKDIPPMSTEGWREAALRNLDILRTQIATFKDADV